MDGIQCFTTKKTCCTFRQEARRHITESMSRRRSTWVCTWKLDFVRLSAICGIVLYSLVRKQKYTKYHKFILTVRYVYVPDIELRYISTQRYSHRIMVNCFITFSFPVYTHVRIWYINIGDESDNLDTYWSSNMLKVVIFNFEVKSLNFKSCYK